MSAWTFLRVSPAMPQSRGELDCLPALLRARDYVPALYPALFDARELLTWGHGRKWCAASAADAAARLRRIGAQALQHSHFAALFEACKPVADWIEESAGGARVVLDFREAAALAEKDLVRELARVASVFEGLGAEWSGEKAVEVIPSWLTGDVAKDAIAACRWTGLDRPRAAFFSLAFGWPDDPSILARWQAWFDAGPTPPNLTDPAADVRLLRDLLAKRGLATFSEKPNHQQWIDRYLMTALRERTSATLATVLEVMLGRGLVLFLNNDSDALADVLRSLEEEK